MNFSQQIKYLNTVHPARFQNLWAHLFDTVRSSLTRTTLYGERLSSHCNTRLFLLLIFVPCTTCQDSAKIIQNDDLPERIGPAILQVKGCFNLNPSYMTDICHLTIYLNLRAPRKYNRTEPNYYRVIAFS